MLCFRYYVSLAFVKTAIETLNVIFFSWNRNTFSHFLLVKSPRWLVWFGFSAQESEGSSRTWQQSLHLLMGQTQTVLFNCVYTQIFRSGRQLSSCGQWQVPVLHLRIIQFLANILFSCIWLILTGVQTAFLKLFFSENNRFWGMLLLDIRLRILRWVITCRYFTTTQLGNNCTAICLSARWTAILLKS